MPFISCLVSKAATEWPVAHICFLTPGAILRINPIHQTFLVSASRILFILKLFYKFLYQSFQPKSYIGQQASCNSH